MTKTLLVLLVLAGCGGSSSSSVTPVSYADLINGYTAAQCSAIFDCCDAERIADTSSEYTDAASCTAAQTDTGVTVPTGFTYDPVAGGTCLKSLKDDLASCSLPLNQKLTIAGCQAALVGNVAEGGDCNDDEGGLFTSNACAPGLTCVGDANGDTYACKKALQNGDACGDGTTVCSDGLVCWDGTCQPPLANGKTCMSSDGSYNNDACDSYNCGQDGKCAATPADFWVCFYDPS